jgi:DNA-directed RNA polymerase specialized sigma24 family protein
METMDRPAAKPSPERSPEHAARVADPRVKAALDAWLQRRVPEADAPDLVQNVLATLLAAEAAPADLEELIALGRRTLQNDVVDYFRHRGIVRRIEVGPVDEEVHENVAAPTPAGAWDRLDVEKRARLVEAMVAGGQISRDDVELLANSGDEGFAGHAQQRGITPTALRVHAHRKRGLLQKRWARYVAYGVVGVIVLIVLYVLNGQEQQVAAPPPPPQPAGGVFLNR